MDDIAANHVCAFNIDTFQSLEIYDSTLGLDILERGIPCPNSPDFVKVQP